MHTEQQTTAPKIIIATPCAFPLGNLATSRAIWHWMKDSPRFSRFIADSIGRHARKDWGDLDREDIDANNRDLIAGERLVSAYKIPASCPDTSEGKIYIITERDRSSTTVFFPSEY